MTYKDLNEGEVKADLYMKTKTEDKVSKCCGAKYSNLCVDYTNGDGKCFLECSECKQECEVVNKADTIEELVSDLIVWVNGGDIDFEASNKKLNKARTKAKEQCAREVVKKANKIVKEELDSTSNIFEWHMPKCFGHQHDTRCPVVHLRRKIEERLEHLTTKV